MSIIISAAAIEEAKLRSKGRLAAAIEIIKDSYGREPNKPVQLTYSLHFEYLLYVLLAKELSSYLFKKKVKCDIKAEYLPDQLLLYITIHNPGELFIEEQELISTI